MKRVLIALATIAVLSVAVTAPVPAGKKRAGASEHWPQWRGPLGTGVAPRATPPIHWSEEKNVRWKIPIPGVGHSTPVIWGDRVFLTTAIPHGESARVHDEHHADGAHDNAAPLHRMKFVVLAVSRRDGSILWQRTVRDERPHESAHLSAGWASGSPVTDGKHLIASFGSRGIFGLDLDGKLLWEVDLGDMQVRHGHGEGSSPALFGNTVVVNWDHQGQSFVVALDKRTGRQRWKVARDEITSWSSPLIVEHDGKPQVVVAATRRVRSYDLATGKSIWECAGLSRNVVASPVAGDGILYVANSYDTRSMLAIRLADARGDVTGTDAVVWTRDRDTPYVPSPLLYRGGLYFLRHYQGILTQVEAGTGRVLYGPRRLPGIENVYASPVAADGRVYVVDRDGTTVVLESGPEGELLARNQLDESFSASPAVVGDTLVLRGERHLYCIARTERSSRRQAPG